MQISAYGYEYAQETGLYYLQSRYYNPNLGRFLNADALYSTGQGFVGNNMFAYCGNNPVNNADPFGLYIVAEDPQHGCMWVNLGSNATGASTASYSGCSGGVPLPMVDLDALLAAYDVISDAIDIVEGIKSLAYAAEYGIKAYSSLRKDLAGTGLEAHHIVEVRFLKGLGLDTKNAPSVALTKEEHQRFTNL